MDDFRIGVFRVGAFLIHNPTQTRSENIQHRQFPAVATIKHGATTFASQSPATLIETKQPALYIERAQNITPPIFNHRPTL
ncbi:MAG: hypothetical protein IJC63_09095 [Myxococcaceae bacterium]|nr:hypothetical protein [Myxococcaceae bacterium]